MSWRAALRYDPKQKLEQIDPSGTPCFDGRKSAGRAALEPIVVRLTELQNRLWAARSHGLLVVLQGRDASGKDGTIRHVIGRVHPLGFASHPFGPPNDVEAAHDFLWRVHRAVPQRGYVTAFNRSHYEDVLVRRVRGFDPESRWRPRLDHIRHFESLLAGDGDTVIVKLFLHVSRDEQAERLRARLTDPQKAWKFQPSDLEDRARWADYDRAYTEALRATDTDDAPWYVIPADRKWYRDLAVANVLLETLESLDLQYPSPVEGIESVVVE